MLRRWIVTSCAFFLPFLILSGTIYVACSITLATIRYRQGEYQAATTIWLRLSKIFPGSTGIAFNSGVTLYRQGEYGKAATEFSRAARSNEPALSATARYNLGNALLRQGDAVSPGNKEGAAEFYRQAIVRYEEAARLEGANQDARFNLVVARSRLQKVSSSPPEEKSAPGTEHRKKKGSEGDHNREQTPRKKRDASKLTDPAPGDHTGSSAEGGDDRGNGNNGKKPLRISRQDAEALLREQRQPGRSAVLFRDPRKPGQSVEVIKDW